MIGWKGGREGGKEGWVDTTTFNNSFTSFCFSLKRSSWDASFLAWKKEGKCFNNGNDDNDEEDDGNNNGGGGDDMLMIVMKIVMKITMMVMGMRMMITTECITVQRYLKQHDVRQIQRWRHGRVVFSDVVHPHLRARKHVLLIDVPLDNIIIKY